MPQKPKQQLPPLKNHSPVGENIAKARKKSGITQQELAEVIGITQTLVSKYEKGKLQTSAEMIIRFANALNISADKLLGLTEIMTEKDVSLKISRRMNKIETLPETEQRALLKTIDIYLKTVE